MKAKSKLPLLFILIFFCVKNSFAQELNCQVSVLTPQIQASDKTIYDKLQSDLREFLIENGQLMSF